MVSPGWKRFPQDFPPTSELLLGQVREDLDLAQIVDQTLPVSLVRFSAKSHLTEVLMNELHCNRAFAHARRDPLH
jgi:hypothetical protein